MILLLALLTAVPVPALPGAAARADSLVGTWTGTLVLDNSAPNLAFVFAHDSADAARLTLTVLVDGDDFGSVTGFEVAGTTVRFSIREFGFVGVLSGDRLTFSIDNARGRTFTVVTRRRPSGP